MIKFLVFYDSEDCGDSGTRQKSAMDFVRDGGLRYGKARVEKRLLRWFLGRPHIFWAGV